MIPVLFSNDSRFIYVCPMKKIFSIIFFLIFYSAISFAEGGGKMFRKIPNADGIDLSQATVYDIKKAENGFVWIATDDGLIRFDGEHSIRVELPAQENGSPVVRSVAMVHDRVLLAGTDHDIYKITLDNGYHKVEPLFEGKPFSATCGITTASGDAIIGGDDGLVIYYHGTDKVARVKLSDNVLNLSNNVIAMAESPNAVYVLTKGGVFRYDKASHAVTPVKSAIDLGGLSPTSIACSEGRLYIGTSGKGVLSLNPFDGKVEHTPYVISGNVVTSLGVSGDRKSLFIGTDGGGVTKVELSSGKATLFRHRSTDLSSPKSNQVYSILIDRQGLLWVGYYQNGVDYTPHSVGPFELYDNPLVFNSRGTPIRALCIDGAYRAIGTREGVVVHYANDEVWEVGSPYLRSEMVISLLSRGDKIFVGTYGGGMSVIDAKTRTVSDYAPAREDQVFRNGHVFSIATDPDGSIWAGTNDGLYHFSDNGEVAHFTSYLTALPEGNVYGIFFDSEGKGWICTDSGICVYDPERKMLRTDLFPVSFPKDKRFRSVYEDSRKRLYFVPENGYVYSCGLDFSDPKTLDYTLLKDSDAKSVVEDSFGDIWISTNRGIFRTDTAGHTMRFGLSSGLPSVSFLQAQPMPDGIGGIWFGNAEGLLRLDEKSIESSVNRRCPPVPTKVMVNGKPIGIVPQRDGDNGAYIIRLDEFANNVKIGFSTFSYAIEEPETYEYKVGDGSWIPFKNDMAALFYDLMPGTHTVSVRSVSDDAVADDKETVVHLVLPYPLMWKAVFGVVLTLVALCVFLISRSVMRRRRLKQLLEAPQSVAQATPVVEQETPRQKKYVSNTMTRNEAREISAKIDEIMAKEKPYLQPDLKVARLADMVGISSHKLSQFFSQHKDQSFYDYVNKYRVDEFKRMVKEEDVKNLTLSAMAERAGFSSRASFFRYFKNIEGISPGEYLKSRQ